METQLRLPQRETDGTLAAMQPLDETARKLRVLRTERDVSRAEVSQATGIPEGTVKAYELADFGRLGPSLNAIGSLAEYYRVSLDWLCGMSDDRNALPAGHVVVDTALVEAIKRAKSFKVLRESYSKEIVRRGIPYLYTIPANRKLFRPTDPELEAIRRECSDKLEELQDK